MVFFTTRRYSWLYHTLILGLVFLLAALWIRILVYLSREKPNFLEAFTNAENNSDVTLSSVPDISDLMIVGYMRGGTTFLGDIMGVRKDNFYMYEPLHKLNKFGFFYNNSICNIKDNNCIPGTVDETRTVVSYMTSIYNCQFQKSWDKISMWMFAKGRGLTNWNDIPECSENLMPSCSQHTPKACMTRQRWCLNKMANNCHQAKSRVTKVLRMGMDLVEEFLISLPKLKIIYLLRDPRAIMNSRYEIWKFLNEDQESAATSLCQKMKLDYVSALNLSRKYPDRIFTVFYEDLVSRPHNITQELFRFVGYSYQQEDNSKLKILTGEHKDNNTETMWNTIRSAGSVETARKWRGIISPLALEKVDNACKSVYTLLNYIHFDSLADLWDVGKPSSKFM